MQKQMTYEERFRWMTETPVEKLIPKLAVATITSMLVTSLYNLADSLFVGYLGTEATAAVNVAFPLMTMIQTFGFTLGMGAGNFVSRSLGKQDRESAQRVASTAFYTSIFIGLIFAILGLIFLKPFMYFLGSDEASIQESMDYSRYILIATPYMAASFVLNNLLRSQGNAKYSMYGIAAGGVLNIFLDALFVLVFQMGVAGAAIATAISQFISFCILLYMILRCKDIVKVHPRYFTLKWWPYKEILHGGLPTLCRQGLASASGVVLNHAARAFGSAALSAIPFANKIMMIMFSVLIGFGQGFQPVCGFNYGAKRYDRVIRAYWFCVKVAFVMMTTLAVGCFFAGPYIFQFYRRDDLEVIQIGTKTLRFMCMTVPLQGWIIMVNMLTQSIGYGIRASIVAMGRQGLFYIPALLILPKWLGLVGLQMSQMVSDMFTFVLATIIVMSVLRDLKEKMKLEGQG